MSAFIELKPMRMSEIPSIPQQQKSSKYLPPNLRGSHIPQQIEKAVNMTTNDSQSFPELGLSQKKSVAWGKHVIRTTVAPPVIPLQAVVVNKDSLSEKIKEKIRQETLDEVEKTRSPETDILKMTEGQLRTLGWDLLSVGNTRVPLNSNIHRKFCSNAPLGLSFDDYSYYLESRPALKVARTILPNTPIMIEEVEEDEEEDCSMFDTERSRHEIW
jgi:hypothetical protein